MVLVQEENYDYKNLGFLSSSMEIKGKNERCDGFT